MRSESITGYIAVAIYRVRIICLDFVEGIPVIGASLILDLDLDLVRQSATLELKPRLVNNVCLWIYSHQNSLHFGPGMKHQLGRSVPNR